MTKKIEVTDSAHIELATSQYINHLLDKGRVVMVQDGGPVMWKGKPSVQAAVLGHASTLDKNGVAINTYRLVPDAG